MAGRKKTTKRGKRRPAQDSTNREVFPPNPGGLEQTMRALHELLASREFQSEEEVRTFLNQALAGGMIENSALKDDPRHRAQDLAFEAMEARSASESLRLCEEALELDPDCVDALAMRARLTGGSIADVLRGLGEAVLAGQRSLGAEFFEENRGHFWGMVESRPYMRARFELAELLWNAGSRADAVSHAAAMLELNPNDNQGVRFHLLAWYLSTGMLAEARELLTTYDDDVSAIMPWGRVIERLLASDERGAMSALKAAREANAQVEPFFNGSRRAPRKSESSWSPGDAREARLVAYLLHEFCAAGSPVRAFFKERAAGHSRES